MDLGWILGGSWVGPRSIKDPPKIHPRSTQDPVTIHPRSLQDPTNVPTSFNSDPKATQDLPEFNKRSPYTNDYHRTRVSGFRIPKYTHFSMKLKNKALNGKTACMLLLFPRTNGEVQVGFRYRLKNGTRAPQAAQKRCDATNRHRDVTVQAVTGRSQCEAVTPKAVRSRLAMTLQAVTGRSRYDCQRLHQTSFFFFLLIRLLTEPADGCGAFQRSIGLVQK